MTEHLELYERLGFENNEPTLVEIKRRYRKLVQTCHPDKFIDPDEKEKRTEQFYKIQEAYDILCDENKRAAYDKDGLINSNNEEQQMEQAATTVLVKMFNMLIDQIDEDRMNEIDIRKPIFDLLEENKNQCKANLQRLELTLRKIKIAQDRLSKEKGEGSDILKIAMGERVGVTNAEVKNTEKTISVFDKVKDILENYKYDFNNPYEAFKNHMTNTTYQPPRVRF